MELFDSPLIKNINLLPKDGTAHYWDNFLSQQDAQLYFEKLLTTIEWKSDELIMFGKRIITQRKVAWYGNKAFPYTYSHQTKTALAWTNELRELKALIEQKIGENFNACLLNLYHNGNEGMGWHSDDEKELKKNGAIASLSLGATRKFSFRHKDTKETHSLLLENGSLLVMKDATQTHWQHALPKTKKAENPRISLTFRTMGSG